MILNFNGLDQEIRIPAPAFLYEVGKLFHFKELVLDALSVIGFEVFRSVILMELNDKLVQQFYKRIQEEIFFNRRTCFASPIG
jgi:hypothetical protein